MYKSSVQNIPSYDHIILTSVIKQLVWSVLISWENKT